MFGTHDRPRWGGQEGRGRPAFGPGGRRRRGPFGPGGRGRPGGPGPDAGDDPRGGRGRRGGGRGGKGRRSRGDVRLAVLALLTEEPMHGYQILQEIAERSDGAWTPSPGSIYPTISQLADEGLVRTEKAEGRSVVHLTDEGRQWTEQHRAELDAVWSTAAAEDRASDLRDAMRGLVGALKQVGAVGTDEQVAEAARLVEDTRRRLYLVLAGEGPAAGAEVGDDGPRT